ncbi:MAG: LytR/AlgR family response regulator transcription factor [Chitinophagales bacterium]
MNSPDSLKVLIVDDELQSRSLIRKLLLDHFPGMIIEEAEAVSSALEKIDQFMPGLVFLDVQMRGETGFDLLDKIGKVNFGIIFTTAHSEFAVKAFRYSAMDYLMKPLETNEFKAAVEKVLQRIKTDHSSYPQVEYLKELKAEQKIPDKLTIPTPEGFLFISVHDIFYCHAVGNYTQFILVNNRKLISSYTLGYYDELLSDQNFFRIHRSYLINLKHIKMYKKTGGGIVVMNDGEEIDVSRSNKEAFLKLFKG